MIARCLSPFLAFAVNVFVWIDFENEIDDIVVHAAHLRQDVMVLRIGLGGFCSESVLQDDVDWLKELVVPAFYGVLAGAGSVRWDDNARVLAHDLAAEYTISVNARVLALAHDLAAEWTISVNVHVLVLAHAHAHDLAAEWKISVIVLVHFDSVEHVHGDADAVAPVEECHAFLQEGRTLRYCDDAQDEPCFGDDAQGEPCFGEIGHAQKVDHPFYSAGPM